MTTRRSDLAPFAHLAGLSEADLDRLAEATPEAAREIHREIEEALAKRTANELIIAAFGALSPVILDSLVASLEPRALRAGEELVREGEPGDSLFLIASGRFEVVATDAAGRSRRLREVGRGELVGELAILTRGARSATVRALRPGFAFALSSAAFRELLGSSHEAGIRVLEAVATRSHDVRSIISRRESPIRVIAIVAADASDAGKEAALAFEREARPEGGVFRLDARSVRSGLGARALESPLAGSSFLFGRWLEGVTTGAGLVVAELGSHEPSEWATAVLERADRILLAASAGDPAPLSPIERLLGTLELRTPVELALFHRAATPRPVGTAKWLGSRSVAAWHHLREDDPASAARLVRRMTGRARGLVLGGGGARGFVHLGVFRALAERNVDIDWIGGTSMGALAGGAYATDFSFEQMEELATAFSSRRAIFDYTLPFVSLFASSRVSEFLHRMFGDIDTADLWRPFFCVTTNLTRAQATVHESGPLWKSLRATTSIPGFFAPVNLDGDLHSDGMTMNNLPIDLMRERIRGGEVWAVDASPKRERMEGMEIGMSQSGWTALADRLLPWRRRKRLPTMLGILVRAAEVHAIHRLPEIEPLADFVFRPPIEKIRTLDFDAWREVTKIGYDDATAALAAGLPHASPSKLQVAT